MKKWGNRIVGNGCYYLCKSNWGKNREFFCNCIKCFWKDNKKFVIGFLEKELGGGEKEWEGDFLL